MFKIFASLRNDIGYLGTFVKYFFFFCFAYRGLQSNLEDYEISFYAFYF